MMAKNKRLGEVLRERGHICDEALTISTREVYPEGTVLNLRFRLVVTHEEVKTRCEVRHC